MIVLSKLEEREEIHTRLLRVGLAVEESRAYWRNADPTESTTQLSERAFAQRWFGGKSSTRVGYLIATLRERLDPALPILKAWDPVQAQDRAWVCHWHLQLTDPLYRAFTADYAIRRLQSATPTVEKLSSLEWLHAIAPDRWSGATADRLVSGLASSFSEAGFCPTRPGPRPIVAPPLSDHALGYLLYLLKQVRGQGMLLSNPYIQVASMGDDLDGRLKRLPGVSYRKTGGTASLEWQHETFLDWLAHIA